MVSKTVLIVYAHEEPKSFNAALKDVAVETLRGQGRHVILSDLYDMKFNPTASIHDFPESRLERTREPCAAVKQSKLPNDLQAEVDKIQTADLVILQFPIYWLGMPAILKGWVDRCMQVYFRDSRLLMYEHGYLAGKKLVLSFTTGHPQSAYSNTGVSGDMDVILWPMHNALRKPGFQILVPQISFAAASASATERKDMLRAWKDRLSNIFNEEPIPFIHITNFKDGNSLSDEYLGTFSEEKSPNPGQNLGRSFKNGCMTGHRL